MSREAFEAWVHENMPDVKLTRDHPQSYTLLGVRRMWGAWQEAVKQERDACAKAAEEVDEPGWTGYECPNTFNDGKWAAAAAIRARSRENQDV